MREGGITDPDLLSFMLGQAPRLGASYDRFDEDYVRRQYAKAEPYLTVMSYPRGVETLTVNPPLAPPASSAGSQGNWSQRAVPEHEIDTYLNGGWRYVTTLPSGRVIVEART